MEFIAKASICGRSQVFKLNRFHFNFQGYDRSLGVITYVLLSGELPFYDKDSAVLRQNIITSNYSFQHRQWEDISSLGKDFISKLLIVNSSERMTAKQALSHPWIKGDIANGNGVNLRCSLELLQLTQSFCRES